MPGDGCVADFAAEPAWVLEVQALTAAACAGSPKSQYVAGADAARDTWAHNDYTKEFLGELTKE